jgi:hypothetical protein
VLADGTVEDICGYLNHTELVRLRPRLWLPKHSGEHFVPWRGSTCAPVVGPGSQRGDGARVGGCV